MIKSLCRQLAVVDHKSGRDHSHAQTHMLYIAHSLASEPKMKNLGSSELLKHAWEVQFTVQPARLIDIDVKKECLSQVEEEMFEVSARANISGVWMLGITKIIGNHILICSGSGIKEITYSGMMMMTLIFR